MPWGVLLGGDELATKAIEMRLIRKRGEPLLLVPNESRLAKQTLALYPAQTTKARTLKRIWGAAFAAGLPFLAERVSIPICPTNPFVEFLRETAAASTTPRFGLLAGNARTPGQRFVFLVFNEQGSPFVVVKAGVSGKAKELIRREREFLQRAAGVPGVPALQKTFESSEAEALAMNFIEGESPRESDEKSLAQLLGSWIDSSRIILIRETRPWMELERLCPQDPMLRRLAVAFKDKTVSSTVFHGDFVPWNIKVSRDRTWMVFDWERGELCGLPVYDWLHFLIQKHILVAHEPCPRLIQRLDRLFNSPDFQAYASRTGISGIEDELAVLYLLYHSKIVQPSEGLRQSEELLAAMAARLTQ